MKRIVFTLICAALALGVCSAQPPRGFRMKKNEEKRYELRAGAVSMAIDANNGARIISLKYDTTEVLSQIPFPNMYGSTFWTSPQKEWNWPPVFEIDMAPYEVTVLSATALRMDGPSSEKLGMRVSKHFEVGTRNGQQGIAVTYTITNTGDAPRQVAPWEITRVPAEGTIFFDADVSQITPAGLMNFNQDATTGYATYQIDHIEGQNRKINSDGKGWLSFITPTGLKLSKYFDDLDESTPPAPEEAEIQVYVHQGKAYVELESQGAYITLKPQESHDWTVFWTLKLSD